VQNDGSLNLYTANDQVAWSSGSAQPWRIRYDKKPVYYCLKVRSIVCCMLSAPDTGLPAHCVQEKTPAWRICNSFLLAHVQLYSSSDKRLCLCMPAH
jgi:hypothetical protein